MQNEIPLKSENNSTESKEDKLSYSNKIIQENQESEESEYEQEEKLLPPITEKSPSQSEMEESESEVERRECDCCRFIPDEIINMNCVHNICVDCTLNVRLIWRK